MRLFSTVLSVMVLFHCFAKAVCVSSQVAVMRVGPSLKHEVSWQAPRFTPLVEVGRQGPWLRVLDMDQEVHWVPQSAVTNKFRCVSVRKSKAGIYSKPNTSFPADMERVGRYMPLKRLEDEPIDLDGWIHVQDPWGNSFWIQEKNIWKPLKVNNFEF